MALTVNSNIQAMNAYRNLNKTQSSLSSSLEKLSSGLRINRAADDAAGLAISENLKAQIGGIQQASKNAQDGVSLVQTADGALSTTQTILQRLRTLAVQSANGSQSSTSRDAINAEATALKAELTRISATSNFNGVNLLDGTYKTGFAFQIGYRADGSTVTGNTIKVAIDSGASSGAATTATVAGVSATAASTAAFDFSASNLVVHVALDGMDRALTINSNLGSTTLVTSAASLAASLTAAASTAFGGAYLTFAAAADGSISINEVASGAHTVKLVSVAGGTANAGSIGLATGMGVGTDAVAAGAFSVGGLGLGTLDLSTAAGALTALSNIDTAITTVSTARANLGALQNRFQYTVDNLDTTAENLSSAESRVVDTDMASEMVNYTRANILSQAGTSMLAQAKNLPSSILDLLKA